MNTSLTFETDLHYHDKLSDFMSVFAMSPLHVIELDTDENGIERLHDRYRDRVCRATRNANGGRITWNVLLLRFAENEFVLARGDGCNDIEIESARYSLAEIINPVVLDKPEPKRILGFAA